MRPADIAERVREIENVWIPMPDGCRIAARVWLPKSAEREPALAQSVAGGDETAGEQAKSDQPKRSGWWQRRSFF